MRKIFLTLLLFFSPFMVVNAVDLKLNKLSVEGNTIELKDNIYEYDISIKTQYPTASVYVEVAEGINYTVEGNANLVTGNNIVKVKLTDGTSSKEYIINVLKMADDVIELSNNNKLKNLSITGYPLGFDPERLEYNLTIKAEAKLKLSYETENEKAEVYVTGNEGLVNGSVINIKVIAQSGDVREYKIKIAATEVRENEEKFDNSKIDMNLVYFGIAAITITLFLVILNKKS